MDVYFYATNSPADAFELAWGFPEMDALTEMARLLREGYQPQNYCEAFGA